MRSIPTAKFVTLEGSEGVGKTTNLELVKQRIEHAGARVVVTREPGGTELGEQIRELLLQLRTEPMVPLAELLLMFAARAQHVETVIKPALANGDWVLSDRFTDASFAYQGGGRGLADSTIETLQEMVQTDLRPDLTFYLDVAPREGFARIQGRSLDRLEREQLDFYERVRATYLARAAAEPGRFVVVDAAADVAAVGRQLSGEFDHAIARWRNRESGDNDGS